MEREEWRPVAGYEGFYEVSNLGNVRSKDRTRPVKTRHGGYAMRRDKGTNITPTGNGYGYLIVGLRDSAGRKNRYVHRLVAEAFCYKPADAESVNHINHDKADNRAVNLEWLSQKENVQYSAARMRKPKQAAKVSNTGEKYISRQTRRGNVRFRVLIKQVGAYRCFEKLQDAVNFRDEVMKRWQGRAGCADGTGTQNR